MSVTDINTTTDILKKYLDKTFTKEVLDYINFSEHQGEEKLKRLIQNSLVKKVNITDTDIENARKKLEVQINKLAGVQLTSTKYYWHKGRGVYVKEPKKPKYVPPWVFEKETRRASKQLGCEDPKLVKCRVCGTRMGAGQIVCCKCKTMR